ncbi:MAG TPA: rod shape-determining protein MreD [Candidatus Kapabacteria bacterium]|nr:rod shape-determining protein MreD [Candidatus Kapabacteria bacterium]
MKFDLESNTQKLQKQKLLIYPILAVLLGLFQISLAHFIEIGGISPNVMIIFIVWLSIKEGQFFTLFAAFFTGIFYDIIKMDLIGTNALSLLITAFACGFFYKEGKSDLIIRSFKFLLISFIGAIIHNFVYYFLYIRISEMDFWNFFIKYGVASSLYTCVFSFFPILISFKNRSFNL